MSNNNQEESDVSVEPDSDSDSEENRVVNEDEDREEDDEEEWEDINEGDEAEDDGEGNAVDGAEIVSNLVIDMTKMAVDESKLQEFCNDIFSEDSKSQFRGTQEIRKILFVEGILTPFPLSVHSYYLILYRSYSTYSRSDRNWNCPPISQLSPS